MRRRDPDPDWAKMTVSIAALAGFFGVSEAAVLKWGRVNGMPRGTEKGRYPFRECVMWRLNRAQSKSGEDDGDIAEERRKLILAQRIGQELTNSKTRAELLDADLVATAMQHMAALIATQLDGMAARLAPQLSQLRDPTAIAKVVFDECRSVRSSASGAVAAFASNLAGVEDIDTAAEAGRGGVGRRKPRVAAGQSRAGSVANGEDSVLA